jgi:hypothetical protein
MAKRLTILLVALLALGFVVSGCGDDDDDKADETATTQEATTEDKGVEQDGGSATRQARQDVETCKKKAAADPRLSDRAKDKIGEVCEESASGDAEGAIKATREACEILVEDAARPGPEKEKALDACRQTKAR